MTPCSPPVITHVYQLNSISQNTGGCYNYRAMHEMSFVISIIDTVLKEAEKKGLENISSVKASVGAMTGALPEYLEKYFREASKGTLLEHAVLETKIIPVTAECSDCGSIYTPERSNGYLCPVCRSSTGRVIQGRDIVVDSVICD